MIMPNKLTLLFFGLFVVSHAMGCRPRDIAEREGRFVVSIHHNSTGLNKTLCTGSIVAERYVMTAARCILTPEGAFKTPKFQIVAGTRDLHSTNIEHRVVADVVEMFVPAGKSDLNDIAILKIGKDFDFGKNPNIDKVDLPKNKRSYTNVKGTVIGFGWSNITNGTIDGKMRYANVKVSNCDDCMKLTKKHIYARVKDHHDHANSEDICVGDSGGPLIHDHVLIGVAISNPLTCLEDVQSGMYARVDAFAEFIEKVLGGNIKIVLSSELSS